MRKSTYIDELKKILRSGGTLPFVPHPRQLVQLSASAGLVHGLLLDRYLEIGKAVKENKPRLRDKRKARNYLQELLARLQVAAPINESDGRILYEMIELFTSDEPPTAIAGRIEEQLAALRTSDASGLLTWVIMGIAEDAARRLADSPHEIVPSIMMGVGAHDIAGGILGALHGVPGGLAMMLATALIEAPIHSLLAAI
jgi:hypothetical protein